MKKIVAVVGARPNYVKLAPILRAAAHPEFAAALRFVVVHTGQHYDEAVTSRVYDDLALPPADHHLGIEPGSAARQLAAVVTRLEAVLLEENPDLVLVVGDVTSTLAAALCADTLGIRIAHVEAGLRSFDRAMPEERNRILTDRLSDILFTTEPVAAENLAREGLADRRIHFVGNVMIDSLDAALPLLKERTILADLGLEAGGRHVLVTLHRPSTVDRPERLEAILDALASVARRRPVLFPLHPRVERRLTEFGLWPRVQRIGRGDAATAGRILAAPALGYLDFLRMTSDAAVVLTDSGGVQEETTALGVPYLTLRGSTERPVTVTHGTNRILGDDPAVIEAAVEKAAAGPRLTRPRPPLWDGNAARRIVVILRDEA